MDAAPIIAALQAAVPGAVYEPGSAADQPTLFVARDRLLDTCRALRDHPALRFSVLVDVTAVDWWPREPRFEIVYHLVSADAATPARLRLKVRLAAEDAHLPSVQAVWAAADWLEREVWDLFGVIFDQRDDLRRLMMPDDWEGHPLRKDYPVQIAMKPKVYEPLQLTAQEFQANIAADGRARGGPGGGESKR